MSDAQRKSAWEALKDLEKPRPMNRLLEGDVGSGKTIVAAIASLNVVKAGYQAAYLAPTEILANQHFRTFSNLLEKFGVKIGLVAGKKKLDEEVDILIGTHALLQDKIKFSKLALAIIDEQHRFGVEQRAKLCRQKNFIPHLLSMTATPIPRTLTLTIYGDLDLSVIDELPKGRKKIITKIIQPKDKTQPYNFIAEQVKEGRQVFVICPRIDPPKSPAESSSGQAIFDERKFSWMDVKAVKQEYEKLSKDVFPDLRLNMLHGKMKSQEKEDVMKDFKEGKIDILVSTSVVEVGIDVPNASVMMIEGADRFGLSQLHQFRGRVGRAEHQSYCFLFAESSTQNTVARLKILVESEDGFRLAEKDLQLRGPGQFFGREQSGLPDLAMSSLKDTKLIEEVQRAVKMFFEKADIKNYPLLQNKLNEFKKEIHWE